MADDQISTSLNLPRARGRSRPRKLPFGATLVLRASQELTLAEKLVWLDDHAFDRSPEGAYASARSRSARWGGTIAQKTIELARGRLRRLGLHERIPRDSARNPYGWISTLPPACVPVARVNARDIEQLAARLDEHIRAIGNPSLAIAPTDVTTSGPPMARQGEA